MLNVPDRMREVRSKIEAGEPVDFQRVAQLQELDTVIVGQDYAEEAAQRWEDANAELKRHILDRSSNGVDDTG